MVTPCLFVIGAVVEFQASKLLLREGQQQGEHGAGGA